MGEPEKATQTVRFCLPPALSCSPDQNWPEICDYVRAFFVGCEKQNHKKSTVRALTMLSVKKSSHLECNELY